MNLLPLAIVGALGVTYVFPACSKAEEGVKPYIGVYLNSSSTAPKDYEVYTAGGGLSLGANYNLTEKTFLQGEINAGQYSISPSLGIGYKFPQVHIAFGITSGQEKARYVFGGDFPAADASASYLAPYIELSRKGFFLRYSRYTADYSFTSRYAVYNKPEHHRHKRITEVKRTSADFRSSRDMLQVGYRLAF